MRDKVLVSVRARPLIRREKDTGDQKNWECKDNEIQACHHPGSKKLSGQPFYFDRVFDEDKTTPEIYSQVVSQIVEKSLQGYNGTVMCYGQTSSGKTHTLYGNDKEPGIISLTAQHLFDLIKNDETRTYYIRVGLLEVYNEKVSDLINNGSPVDIHERNGVVAPTDLKEIEVVSAEEMLKAAKIVQAKRKIGETKLNKQSSRSHTILRIFIESVPNDEDSEDEEDQIQVTNALLNFVDLAGSEKANQTGAAGERLKEATFINRSLSVLSQVVLQLSGTANVKTSTSAGQNPKGTQKQSSSNQTVPQFINYRDSKLTRLLQSSLSGNAFISLICNITPAAAEETASTLRFARTAKNIKLDPTKNQGPPTGAQYRIKILELENVVEDKSSEVESLRKKIVAIQKFCQPLQPAPIAQPFIPLRRKTVGPSVMTGPRKEIQSVSQESDSQKSQWQAREQLLVFQLEKLTSEKTLAELTLLKSTERNQCLCLENEQLKLRLSQAEKILGVVALGKNNDESNGHSNSQHELSTNEENVHKNGKSPQKLHFAGSEAITLMIAAEQSRQNCTNIIADLMDQIKLIQTKNQ